AAAGSSCTGTRSPARIRRTVWAGAVRRTPRAAPWEKSTTPGTDAQASAGVGRVLRGDVGELLPGIGIVRIQLARGTGHQDGATIHSPGDPTAVGDLTELGRGAGDSEPERLRLLSRFRRQRHQRGRSRPGDVLDLVEVRAHGDRGLGQAVAGRAGRAPGHSDHVDAVGFALVAAQQRHTGAGTGDLDVDALPSGEEVRADGVDLSVAAHGLEFAVIVSFAGPRRVEPVDARTHE